MQVFHIRICKQCIRLDLSFRKPCIHHLRQIGTECYQKLPGNHSFPLRPVKVFLQPLQQLLRFFLRKQSFPYIQLLIFVAGLRSLKFVQKQHLIPHGKASLPHFLKITALLLHPQYRFPLSGTAPQLRIDFFIHPRNKLPQNFTVPLTVLRECFFL